MTNAELQRLASGLDDRRPDEVDVKDFPAVGDETLNVLGDSEVWALKKKEELMHERLI